jgi:hypothetical protein
LEIIVVYAYSRSLERYLGQAYAILSLATFLALATGRIKQEEGEDAKQSCSKILPGDLLLFVAIEVGSIA